MITQAGIEDGKQLVLTLNEEINDSYFYTFVLIPHTVNEKQVVISNSKN